MPPKRRRAKSKSKPRTTQSQKQTQRVTVNIGSTRAKRKQSGRGGLPPPSHLQNLAPTFVTSGPQVDYVNLIGEISRLTKPVVQDPVPIRNPVTPLQSTIQASNTEAQLMAGQKAEERRAGPTVENFQEAPSVSDFVFTPAEQTPASKKFFNRPETRRQYSERGMMGAEDTRGFVSSAQERGRQAAATRRFTQELQRQGVSQAPPLVIDRSGVGTLSESAGRQSASSVGGQSGKPRRRFILDPKDKV